MKQKIYLIFFILLPLKIFAQNYNFEQYTIENGLSQSQVYSITQDDIGNIWFGTFGGSITIFNSVISSYINTYDGLPHHSILELHTAQNGFVWIGTAGGIAFYDGLQVQNPIPEFDYAVRSIQTDKKNNIWFSSDSGIFVYDWKNLKKFADNFSIKNKIFIDKDDNFYYTKRNGFYRFSDTSEVCILEVENLYVQSIIQSKNNDIWVGTYNGLYQIVIDDFVIKYDENIGLPGNSITDLCEDGYGNIWIATQENGLSIFDGEDFHNINSSNGIGFDHIMSLYKDKSNNIWVGIDGNGAFLFKGFKFKHLKFDNLLKNNFIMCVFVENHNKILLGTDGEGLIILEKNKKTLITKADGLVDNYVYHIDKDKFGNYWFATNEGLSKYDGKNFTNFKEETLISTDLMTIEIDNKNNIWLGTNGSGFVKIIDGNINNIEISTHIEASTIWDFFEAKNGDMYLSTDNGLFIINNTDTIHYTKADGLNELNLGSICQDENGIIWIGTDSGISRFDGKKFRNYTTEDGLNSNMCYILSLTPQGNLIYGSEKGIDKIIYDKFGNFTSIKFYGKEEGFLGIECNFNAIDTDSLGNMYFGTMDGLTIYDTNNDSTINFEAFINISNVKLFYEDVDWKLFADSVLAWSKLPVNPVFNYKQNNLTFEFYGTDFLNPEKIRYKFMLEGFDEFWMPITSSNYATYSNLPHGEYTFKVLAITSENIENSVPATFKFTIKPPFWKTTWFYLFSGIFIILMIILIFNIRTRKLKYDKIKLEEIVKERTAEIVQQKEEILAQRDEIEIQKEEIEVQRDFATKQRDEIAKQKKDITDSILYAKRIQTALLPRGSILKKYFKESQIIFIPKDIVSGDFYWMKKIENNVLIAVADCTGHGVPGAFMSMLGIAFLNEIVSRREITQTSEVLNELRYEIITSLKQYSDTSAMDGMDIAIICYDIKKRNVQFSGAYNSLFLLRKNDINTFDLTEYKGDRMPISAYIGQEHPFNNYYFDVQENDVMYLFTDGFYDQIDENFNQKYMKSNLKNKLIEIQDKNLLEQKNILQKELDNWKGEAKQIDDILVLSLKF